MRMIPPVMTTPCADHDSRVVVDRRGRSVVDGRGGVVHRWGHDYWRNYTATDPDVNIGLSGYGEPRKKCGAEQKAQCLEVSCAASFRNVQEYLYLRQYPAAGSCLFVRLYMLHF